MVPDGLVSLDAVYQHIEDSYALDGEEAKALIASFLETAAAWLEAYDRSPSAWAQIGENLEQGAAGIGFAEFQAAAQRFRAAVDDGESETREEAYRMMAVLLGRLKNEFNA